MVKEFIIFIESIGFKRSDGFVFRYDYKEFLIDLGNSHCEFYNGSEWIKYLSYYDDLETIEKYFKKELRSIKLKQLLR